MSYYGILYFKVSFLNKKLKYWSHICKGVIYWVIGEKKGLIVYYLPRLCRIINTWHLVWA